MNDDDYFDLNDIESITQTTFTQVVPGINDIPPQLQPNLNFSWQTEEPITNNIEVPPRPSSPTRPSGFQPTSTIISKAQLPTATAINDNFLQQLLQYPNESQIPNDATTTSQHARLSQILDRTLTQEQQTGKSKTNNRKRTLHPLPVDDISNDFDLTYEDYVFHLRHEPFHSHLHQETLDENDFMQSSLHSSTDTHYSQDVNDTSLLSDSNIDIFDANLSQTNDINPDPTQQNFPNLHTNTKITIFDPYQHVALESAQSNNNITNQTNSTPPYSKLSPISTFQALHTSFDHLSSTFHKPTTSTATTSALYDQELSQSKKQSHMRLQPHNLTIPSTSSQSSFSRHTALRTNPITVPTYISSLNELNQNSVYSRDELHHTPKKSKRSTTSTTSTTFPLVDSALSTFRPYYQDFLLYTLWGLNVRILHPKFLRGLYQATLRLNSVPIPSPLQHHVTAWNQYGLQYNIPVINDQLQFALIPGLEDGSIQLMSILSNAIAQRCNSHIHLLASANDLPILCIANVLSHILYQNDSIQLTAVIIHLSGNVSTNDTECIQSLCVQLCEQLGLTCSLNHTTATFHDYAQFITVIFRQITTLDIEDVANFDSKYQLHEYPTHSRCQSSGNNNNNDGIAHSSDSNQSCKSNTQERLTSVPIIIVLDGFDLFARSGIVIDDNTNRGVSKQSFLYFLGDLAQTNQAWLHLIAISTSPSSYDFLEKRVKSRFPMHNIYLHNTLYQSPPLLKTKTKKIAENNNDHITAATTTTEPSVADPKQGQDVYNLRAQGATWDIFSDVNILIERLQLAIYTFLALPCDLIDNITPLDNSSLPNNIDDIVDEEQQNDLKLSSTTAKTTSKVQKKINLTQQKSAISSRHDDDNNIANSLHDGPILLSSLLLVPRTWSRLHLNRDFTAPHWTQVFYYNTSLYATLTHPTVVQQVLTPMVYFGVSLFKIVAFVTKIVENLLIYPTLISPTTPPVLQYYPLYCDFVEFKREKRYLQYWINGSSARDQSEADDIRKTKSHLHNTTSKTNATELYKHKQSKSNTIQSFVELNNYETKSRHSTHVNNSLFSSIQQVDSIYNLDNMDDRNHENDDQKISAFSTPSQPIHANNNNDAFRNSSFRNSSHSLHAEGSFRSDSLSHLRNTTASVLNSQNNDNCDSQSENDAQRDETTLPSYHNTSLNHSFDQTAQDKQKELYNDHMVRIQNSSNSNRSTLNTLDLLNIFPSNHSNGLSFDDDLTQNTQSELDLVIPSSSSHSHYKPRKNTNHFRFLTPWRGTSAIASILIGPWDLFTAYFWLMGHIVDYETTYCELHNQLISKPFTFFFKNLQDANALDTLYSPNGINNVINQTQEIALQNQNSLPHHRTRFSTILPTNMVSQSSSASGFNNKTKELVQEEFVFDVGYLARLLRFFQSDLSYSSYGQHILTSHETNPTLFYHYLNLCAQNKIEFLSQWISSQSTFNTWSVSNIALSERIIHTYYHHEAQRQLLSMDSTQPATKSSHATLFQTLSTKYSSLKHMYERAQKFYFPHKLYYTNDAPTPHLQIVSFCIEPDPDRIELVYTQYRQYQKLLIAKRSETFDKTKLTKEQKNLLATFSRHQMSDIYRTFLRSNHSHYLIFPTYSDCNIIHPTVSSILTTLPQIEFSTPSTSQSQQSSRTSTPSSQTSFSTPSSRVRSRLQALNQNDITQTPSTFVSSRSYDNSTNDSSKQPPGTPRRLPATPSQMTPFSTSKRRYNNDKDDSTIIDDKLALLQSASGTFAKSGTNATHNTQQLQGKTLINPIASSSNAYFQTEQVLFQQLSRVSCHSLGLLGASLRLEFRGIQSYSFEQLFEEHIAFLFGWSTGQVGLDIDPLELYPTSSDCSTLFDQLIIDQFFVHCTTIPVDPSTSTQQFQLDLLDAQENNTSLSSKQNKGNKSKGNSQASTLGTVNASGTSIAPAHILTVTNAPYQVYIHLKNNNLLLSTPVQCTLSRDSFYLFLKTFQTHLNTIKYTRPLDYQSVPIWVQSLLDLEIRTTGTV